MLGFLSAIDFQGLGEDGGYTDSDMYVTGVYPATERETGKRVTIKFGFTLKDPNLQYKKGDQWVCT